MIAKEATNDMTIVDPLEEQAEWQAVSRAILRLTELSSLDDLLEEALAVWLAQATPDLRWRVALELYRSDQVSSGRAAEIAGLNYFVFEGRLKAEGVKFVEARSATEEEVQQQRSLIHAAFTLPPA